MTAYNACTECHSFPVTSCLVSKDSKEKNKVTYCAVNEGIISVSGYKTGYGFSVRENDCQTAVYRLSVKAMAKFLFKLAKSMISQFY